MVKVTEQLLNEITLQIQPLKSDSTTPAGQTDTGFPPALISAVNGVFEVLAAGYGNQYHAAYPNAEQSNLAKRLWAKQLSHYPSNLIMKVADDIIGKETYLPSIAKFKEYCDNAYEAFGLPNAQSAYIEACRAPQPKKAYHWSHPAVYFAGLATDWFFLSTESRAQVFPVFKRNYDMLCERVIHGEQLDVPMEKALPEEISTPLSKEENQQHLKALRDSLKL